jgi:L-alanine-DL-glutamate epimerase-like enolase superfamily enzyme
VFAASVHLSLNLPNAVFQESVRAYYSTWYRDLVTVVPQVENGWILPLSGPGLGTELKPEILRSPRVRLQRSDVTSL